ncbi:hypothetical protein [Nocardia sp. NPDC059239]|uniref:hypothetical protein n=1 Tax=unclassified Nocardia TaxID=2637762 RepID=UPI0036CBCEEA
MTGATAPPLAIRSRFAEHLAAAVQYFTTSNAPFTPPAPKPASRPEPAPGPPRHYGPVAPHQPDVPRARPVIE